MTWRIIQRKSILVPAAWRLEPKRGIDDEHYDDNSGGDDAKQNPSAGRKQRHHNYLGKYSTQG